jgi:hypothetical protein
MPSTLPQTVSPPHESHIDSEAQFYAQSFYKAITSITDPVAPASIAYQKTIAPAADNYTPPGSPAPEPEATTSTEMTKNPSVKGTRVTLLSPTCTGLLGRVKSLPLYLLSRRRQERPLLSPMTCTPDLEYLGSSVGTTRIDDASKSRDVDATCDHLTCDLLLL